MSCQPPSSIMPCSNLSPNWADEDSRSRWSPLIAAASSIPTQLRPPFGATPLLVSIMHVNNETGVRQPVVELADRLATCDAYLHVDAAQSFARDIDALRHPRIDLISASAHKINGPKGVGALITRRRGQERPPLQPLMFGGGQERGLRPGTMPVALAAGFGLAAELAVAERDRAPGALCRVPGGAALRAGAAWRHRQRGPRPSPSRTSSIYRSRASKRRS